nr:hypothetical protein 2 [Paracoccaceae bacterium]
MLQQDTPDDFIVATGKTHSIRDFLQIAFGHVGLNYENFVVEDPDLLRPSDTIELCGDARKAHEKLNWTNKIEFEQLVIEMVEADLSVLGRGSN